MKQPNILLTRIDNRLVHGQVAITWTTSIGANLIILVDDDVAEDKIQQSIMEITARSNDVGIRFFTIERTANVIMNASTEQKIFIVCRTPNTVRRLLEKGVALTDINVGNMHFSEGKKQLSKKVYVDEKDLEDLRYIKNRGVNVYIQDVPSATIEYIN
ncbi:MAG: PTS galactosamine transporter subunit IIB [Hafnia sp.]|uniref:PTS galactosamine transporter subunit IIB n=1 Tax=Obesumbacterium proteus TaxID=82983 RepID=UPI000620EB7E|nr:PTS galactosamine transporter subunit IIB [Obesumbacterium proteus]KKI49081.1 PTS system N-acetylgalactosamine-specific transporter subunit IIB [Obesumbacterium proteus]MCE9886038.1 PTS N-acetylgalactosamine transporter subunit IIB [Obesumbacterium proteus]MCE9917300.1 PTS N-acetylgalactosamine transporter subunit IIB [Obesumbacterium proteus]MCE9929965.1 PTS N-acetylgalactosamine transporter subunit IIB [Obesumbacterium proteus]MCG2878385.1 PTS N-acetylgalactosamine transporter subunit IIB